MIQQKIGYLSREGHLICTYNMLAVLRGIRANLQYTSCQHCYIVSVTTYAGTETEFSGRNKTRPFVILQILTKRATIKKTANYYRDQMSGR